MALRDRLLSVRDYFIHDYVNDGFTRVRAPDIAALPVQANVPQQWSDAFMAPGMPMPPIAAPSQGDRKAEAEPRTFQYIPSINVTITPRIPYGLQSFSQLKYYGENVPEVSMCRRMVTEEIKTLKPTILDADGKVVDIEDKAPDLFWMITRPDGRNPFAIWLSRLMYNMEVYDAPALFPIREQTTYQPTGMYATKLADPMNIWDDSAPAHWNCKKCKRKNKIQNLYCPACYEPIPEGLLDKILIGKPEMQKLISNGTPDQTKNPIIGLRVLDGSTILALIDDNGETPAWPAPAYTQIIWGVPRIWLNSEQLWYKPRFVRADAPYGLTWVEDSQRAVDYLDRLWKYETAMYTEGTMPEMFLGAPESWTPEQCLAWERAFNARMGGNVAEQRRLRVIPAGFEKIETKVRGWNKEGYKTAFDRVQLAAGIPTSETGQAPGKGLGGKGYQEEGTSQLWRTGIGPRVEYVEAIFDDTIKTYGDRYKGWSFELQVVTEEMDATKRADKSKAEFDSGAITLDEYREDINRIKFGGTAGKSVKLSTGMTFQPVDELGAPAPAPVIQTGGSTVGEAQPADKPDGDRGEPETLEPGKEDKSQGLNGKPKDEQAAKLAKLFPGVDLAKHCGVCEEDDAYYMAPVSRVAPIEYWHTGANDIEIVAIGKDETRPALWKPVSGEDEDLVAAAGGSFAPREEAAYLVDRRLEFGLVPVAYVAEVDGEQGAIMMYVRGSEPRQDVSTYAPAWQERAAVLDYILGQMDRRAHNWLTHPDDDTRPILIDNGMTFPAERRPVNSAFVAAWVGVGAQVSDEVTRALQVLAHDRGIWKDISELVGDGPAGLAQERLAAVIRDHLIPIEA